MAKAVASRCGLCTKSCATRAGSGLRELRDILTSFERLCEVGDSAVLATIVGVRGSTYRRPGARLMMLSDQTTIGLISGGCLEGDLLQRGKNVLNSGESELIHYDSTSEQDAIWGLGLGCAGAVDVLLERVSASTPGPLVWLRKSMVGRRTGAMATCLSPRLGERYTLDVIGGQANGEVGNPLVAAALEAALASGCGGKMTIDSEDWAVEVFRPPQRLVVFGAGPDAAPVCRFACELGWDVEVLDHRAAYAISERFAGARVQCEPVDSLVAAAKIDMNSYCVVMTHNYLHDQTIVTGLLKTTAPYVAILGSGERARRLLSELSGDDSVHNCRGRERVFSPAGLDIGADAPEQIALAIVAEIQAIGAGRPGGTLRARKGPIHVPPLG